jgi:hypothetical protein
MLVRSVIHDKIDEHAHPALFAGLCKFDKVAEGAVPRIDVVIIGNIVTVVSGGRGPETASATRP